MAIQPKKLCELIMDKKNKLLEIVADILEVESVNLNTELNEDNWDSLAVVTFISEIDSTFNIIVSPSIVSEASSVQKLFDLI